MHAGKMRIDLINFVPFRKELLWQWPMNTQLFLRMFIIINVEVEVQMIMLATNFLFLRVGKSYLI